MIITEALKDELYGQHRLVLKKRIHRNVFFPDNVVVEQNRGDNNYSDLLQEDDARVYVNCLDPFQSFDDFHNELRSTMVKPLMCEYLSAKHQLMLSFELSMLLIDCITFSPHTVKSLENVVNYFFLSGFYAVNGVFAEASATAIFTLRCLMTVADLIYRLFNPAEQQLPVAQAILI